MNYDSFTRGKLRIGNRDYDVLEGEIFQYDYFTLFHVWGVTLRLLPLERSQLLELRVYEAVARRGGES